MSHCYTKPLDALQDNIRYFKHKGRLESIKNKHKNIIERDTISQMHRIRQYSKHFHTQRQETQIGDQNQRFLNRLLFISKMKKSEYSQKNHPSKINHTLSPVRKKNERNITDANEKLANRLIDKRSQFDEKNIKKRIQSYQKIKKTMRNNRKVHLNYYTEPMKKFPPLDRMQNKKQKGKQYHHIETKYNPEQQDYF